MIPSQRTHPLDSLMRGFVFGAVATALVAIVTWPAMAPRPAAAVVCNDSADS